MIVFIIGACVHALVGAGVFFAKEEPHKAHIFVATMLKGLLVALLIGFSLKAGASLGIWTGAGHCLLYGLAFGVVVFLAKGSEFQDEPASIGRGRHYRRAEGPICIQSGRSFIINLPPTFAAANVFWRWFSLPG